MTLLDKPLLSDELVSAILSAIGVLISVAISLVLFFLSERKVRKERLTTKFDIAYKKAFSIKRLIEKQMRVDLIDERFYFELDYMLNNEDIQNKILDYITEVENYFSIVVGKYKLDKSFQTLSSFALYSRWCALYGFVMKMREKNKSKQMFRNFINVIDKMEIMEKVKNRMVIPKDLYYVGIRQSDCTFAQVAQYEGKRNDKIIQKKLFQSSINMFPGKGASFPVRPNPNINGKIFLPYVENQISEIITRMETEKETVAPKFLFYNPSMAYKLSDCFRKYFVCLNDKTLLNELNDKITCRTWLLNHGIKIVDIKTMLGKELLTFSFETICKSSACVIQSNYGGGGVGTYLLDKNSFEQIKTYLNPLAQYIVSPYINNSFSANTHVFISDKQTILSPASVQIIEVVNHQLCYRGADFIAFKRLDQRLKDDIRDTSIKIANLLRDKGYRGVAGIDFIIAQDGSVYCSEINPRFQASSVLLDLYLAKNKNLNLAHSVFELNFQAFNNSLKSDLCFDDDVGFSCHYYYDDGKPQSYFAEKLKLFQKYAYRVDTDGFDPTDERTDNNSYLFRAIFDHPICAISPDNTLWINDNIIVGDCPTDMLHLKVALLNQGVRIENIQDNIKKGVYESIDILFKGTLSKEKSIDINCAFEINLARYSPFVLDGKDNQLKYFGQPLGSFAIEQDLPEEISGISRKILYMAADRIRIKMIRGCEFKNYGLGCEFCNLPYSEGRFSFTDIRTALDQLKMSGLRFRHILIGGGTCLAQNAWEEIITLAKYLKADDYFKDKPLSLMTMLPPPGEDGKIILRKIKDAGIEEVAFNLEISDETLAKKLMPGKYKGKEIFYEVMKNAVDIFGVNSVRSALIVGLDKKYDVIHEIRTMAKCGIMPCLSALRALQGAKANLTIHPSNEYLIDVYRQCEAEISGHNYKIESMGPPCHRCRNNMLIV